MERNPWRRAGYVMSFIIVAGVAAAISYSHIRDVAEIAHQPALIAHLLPLSVDGLMLVASLAMGEDKAANRHPRGWARFGFWFGASVSVSANVSSVVVHYGWDWLGIAVAGLAPVALLVCVEIVSRPGRAKKSVEAETLVAAMAEVPVSPAPAGSSRSVEPTTAVNKRGEYGPRDPERGYAPSTVRAKKAAAKSAVKAAQ